MYYIKPVSLGVIVIYCARCYFFVWFVSTYTNMQNRCRQNRWAYPTSSRCSAWAGGRKPDILWRKALWICVENRLQCHRYYCRCSIIFCRFEIRIGLRLTQTKQKIKKLNCYDEAKQIGCYYIRWLVSLWRYGGVHPILDLVSHQCIWQQFTPERLLR